MFQSEGTAQAGAQRQGRARLVGGDWRMGFQVRWVTTPGKLSYQSLGALKAGWA